MIDHFATSLPPVVPWAKSGVTIPAITNKNVSDSTSDLRTILASSGIPQGMCPAA
jgi:hypothetical protein